MEKKSFKNDAPDFLILNIFQMIFLKSLSRHMINPKSSTIRDINLTEILMSYNDQEVITINSLEDGVCFKTSDGREFRKIKRYERIINVWN